MKNRILEAKRNKTKNGKFFCWHDWEVVGEVGGNWDLCISAKLPCKCKKCDKYQEVSGRYIEEVPDRLVNNRIEYYISL